MPQVASCQIDYRHLENSNVGQARHSRDPKSGCVESFGILSRYLGSPIRLKHGHETLWDGQCEVWFYVFLLFHEEADELARWDIGKVVSRAYSRHWYQSSRAVVAREKNDEILCATCNNASAPERRSRKPQNPDVGGGIPKPTFGPPNNSMNPSLCQSLLSARRCPS